MKISKSISKSIAKLLTKVAQADVSTASLFAFYQPTPPKKNK